MLMGPDGEGWPIRQQHQDPQASYQPDTQALSNAVSTAEAADKKAASTGAKKDYDTADNDWTAVANYMADMYRRADQSSDPKAAVASLDKTLQSQMPNGDLDSQGYTWAKSNAKAEVLGGTSVDGTKYKGESATLQNASIQDFSAHSDFQQSPTDANGTAMVQADIQLELVQLYGDGNNGVYTADQISKAVSAVQSEYDPKAGPMIQEIGFTTLYGELQGSPGSLNLTPAQQQLLKVDPISLTFLMLAGVPMKGTLSPAMLQLAQQNSSLFTYLELNNVDINIDSHPNPDGTGVLPGGQFLHITVDGNPYVPGSGPDALSLDDLAHAYVANDGSGGISGVAAGLLPSLKISPGTITDSSPILPLIGAADSFRLQWATGEFQNLVSQAPAANSSGATDYVANTLNPFLDQQLNGFLSFGGPQSDRAAFWSQVTSGAALPAYITQVLQSGGKIGDALNIQDTALMNGVLKNASPEVAQGTISVMMNLVEKSKSSQRGQGTQPGIAYQFLTDFNQAAQIADQEPGLQKTNVTINGQQVQVGPWATKVANWFLGPQGTGASYLVSLSTSNDIADVMRASHSDDLGAALYMRVQAPPQGTTFDSQFVDYMKYSVNDGVKDNGQTLSAQVGRAEYDAFQSNSALYLGLRFDKFAHSTSIGTTLPAVDTPALRNAVGLALGGTPQNPGADPNTQDLWDPKSAQGKVIALDVFWILNQAGTGGTVTILPYLYVSKDQGLQNGVFFQTQSRPTRDNSGHTVPGKTSWIDGFAALPALQMDPNALQHPDSVDVKWHYNDFSDFQLNNDLYQGGTVYMLAGNQVTQGRDGHVKVVEEASSRSDAWKDFKTTMNYVAGGAGIAGGILLAPFTGGASTALTVAGATLLAGSVAWNAYSDYSTYTDMTDHGEHYGWSNPNAHMAIEGDVMTAVQPAVFAMAGAGSLLRVGDEATGVIASVRSVAATGLQGTAKVVGVSAAAYGGYQSSVDAMSLVQNWSHMSGSQRAQSVLNIGINVAGLGTNRMHDLLDGFLTNRQNNGAASSADTADATDSTSVMSVSENPDTSGTSAPPRMVVDGVDPRSGLIVPIEYKPTYDPLVAQGLDFNGVLKTDQFYQVLTVDAAGNIIGKWQQPNLPGHPHEDMPKLILVAQDDGAGGETFSLMPVVAGASGALPVPAPTTTVAAIPGRGRINQQRDTLDQLNDEPPAPVVLGKKPDRTINKLLGSFSPDEQTQLRGILNDINPSQDSEFSANFLATLSRLEPAEREQVLNNWQSLQALPPDDPVRMQWTDFVENPPAQYSTPLNARRAAFALFFPDAARGSVISAVTDLETEESQCLADPNFKPAQSSRGPLKQLCSDQGVPVALTKFSEGTAAPLSTVQGVADSMPLGGVRQYSSLGNDTQAAQAFVGVVDAAATKWQADPDNDPGLHIVVNVGARAKDSSGNVQPVAYGIVGAGGWMHDVLAGVRGSPEYSNLPVKITVVADGKSVDVVKAVNGAMLDGFNHKITIKRKSGDEVLENPVDVTVQAARTKTKSQPKFLDDLQPDVVVSFGQSGRYGAAPSLIAAANDKGIPTIAVGDATDPSNLSLLQQANDAVVAWNPDVAAQVFSAAVLHELGIVASGGGKPSAKDWKPLKVMHSAGLVGEGYAAAAGAGAIRNDSRFVANTPADTISVDGLMGGREMLNYALGPKADSFTPPAGDPSWRDTFTAEYAAEHNPNGLVAYDAAFQKALPAQKYRDKFVQQLYNVNHATTGEKVRTYGGLALGVAAGGITVATPAFHGLIIPDLIASAGYLATSLRQTWIMRVTGLKRLYNNRLSNPDEVKNGADPEINTTHIPWLDKQVVKAQSKDPSAIADNARLTFQNIRTRTFTYFTTTGVTVEGFISAFSDKNHAEAAVAAVANGVFVVGLAGVAWVYGRMYGSARLGPDGVLYADLSRQLTPAEKFVVRWATRAFGVGSIVAVEGVYQFEPNARTLGTTDALDARSVGNVAQAVGTFYESKVGKKEAAVQQQNEANGITTKTESAVNKGVYPVYDALATFSSALGIIFGDVLSAKNFKWTPPPHETPPSAPQHPHPQQPPQTHVPAPPTVPPEHLHGGRPGPI